MLAYGGPGDWPDDGCPKLEFAWEYAQTQEGGRVEYALLYTGRGRLCLDRIGRDLHWLGRHALALAYGDEDVLAGGEASHPRFAPAWSPDTFLHHPYLGAVLAVDMALARSLEGEPALLWKEALEAGGGHSPRLAYVEDREAYGRLALALAALAGGFGPRPAIAHVDNLWYRHASPEEQAAFLQPWNIDSPALSARVEPDPGLAVIIPSKDHPEVLEQCLVSLLGDPPPCGFEIHIVDNGSSEENKRKIERLLSRLETAPIEREGSLLERLAYHYVPMDFHFSRMCNLGAEQSSRPLLLFLNDDVSFPPGGIGRQGWEMWLAKAAQPHVGQVGIKLLYPREDMIQHCGIQNLPIGPVHKLQFLSDRQTHYFGWNRQDRNCISATAGGVMLRSQVFWEVGGFPLELPVGFNDVSLGFALHRAGYYNVVLASIHALHHESLSRGKGQSRAQLERVQEERRILYALHPEMEGADPYFPSRLGRIFLDVHIRPGYCELAPGETWPRWRARPFPELFQAREDACLRLGVEWLEHRGQGFWRMAGYCLVLGDGNYGYRRYLVLQRAGGGCWQIYLPDRYRVDLEENMQDQPYGSLGGFLGEADLSSLPDGEYRVGALAKSRLGGLQLLAWSDRYFRKEEAGG